MIGKRLRKLEELLGLKPLEMAKKGDCSKATYYRYRNSETIPDISFLQNILKNENRISLDWLLEGHGSALKPGNGAGKFDSTVVELPLYHMEPRNDEGEGMLPAEQWNNPEGSIPFCLDFVQQKIGVEANRLVAVTVDCDSMSPQVKAGALVLVNVTQTSHNLDGIFMVRIDDVLRMKLVQLIPDNRMLLSTLNEKYEPIEVDRDSDSVEIKGRIAWVGHHI